MQKIIRGLVSLALVGTAASATAGELKLTIGNGRATLIAQDVPARQILAEWARLGGTKIINAEKLIGPMLTVQMIDRPEREVLDLVLRAASGYVAAPRAEPVANLSVYDRVVILATSNAPAYTPSPAPNTFTRPPATMPVEDEPSEHPNAPPGMPAGMPPGANTGPQSMPPGASNPGPQTMPMPGMPGNQPQSAPGMPTNQPMTSPRPGMLPQPAQPTQPNPFAPPVRPPTGRGGGPPGGPPGGNR